METIKTDALVLRWLKHSESSKIVVLFTEAQGKVTLIAKGVRKSKQHIPLDTFSLLNVVYRSKSSREVQLLTSVDLLKSFLGIRNNLRKLASAFSVCDLMLKTTEPEDANPLLYKAAVDTLEALDKTSSNENNFYWYFLIRLSEAVGFGLDLTKCSICDRKIADFPPGKIRFDYLNGSLICPGCKSGGDKIVLLRPETSKAIQYLSTRDLEKVGRLKLSPEAGKQLEGLLFNFLRQHVEGLRRPRFREMTTL